LSGEIDELGLEIGVKVRVGWWNSRKLPRKVCTAWRHGAYRQAPVQGQCLYVAARCSFGLGGLVYSGCWEINLGLV